MLKDEEVMDALKLLGLESEKKRQRFLPQESVRSKASNEIITYTTSDSSIEHDSKGGSKDARLE